ncbi:MAG: hypothetical protein HN564_01670 [Flavobacteriales bacterium]|jgi:hypothetical protein|nr:hypothetical protein [Flavobacteriales bacterium]
MNNIWRKYHGALIPWKPPHLDLGFSRNDIQTQISKHNAFFARWTTNFDSRKQSVFWYIINDKSIDISDYSANTRSKINRGFKKLTVRKISKSELLKDGYSVYKNALKRYNFILNVLSNKQFISEIENLDENWDLWGVYTLNTNKLVAYSLNRLVDDYCDYSTIKFDPSFLKNYSSYVLYYSMNKYYLNDKNFQYVNNGTRSVSHQTNIHDFLIDKFKFRKAYCKMEVAYSPLLKFFVKYLFFMRHIISFIPLNIFRKLYVILHQENIKILCEKIYGYSNQNPSKLVLSNGNFKSGSTWVTAILNELFNYKIDSFPLKFQNPKHKNWIHRYRIHDFFNSNDSLDSPLWISKSHIFQEKIMNDILINQNNIKIINIDRDIKDIIVSHYHHLLNSKKISGDFKSYFSKWGKYKAKQCIDYKKAWGDYDCLKLKYSDLINSNRKTIIKMAKYLDINIDDDKILSIQNETDIDNLRINSKRKNLNEENWFYRKGKMGDWKNFFDNEMILKIQSIESGNLSFKEKLSYFIKFTFRLKLKYFLYKYIPNLYVKFDKVF